MVASVIICFSCYLLTAQPILNSNKFSTQLKEIINYSKNNFKNIPKAYKLEGAISYSLNPSNGGDLFYHSVFARSVSAESADKTESFLTNQIASAIGAQDNDPIISENGSFKNVSFVSKCNCDIVLANLIIFSNGGKKDIYIDIPYATEKDKHTAVNADIFKKIKKIILDQLEVDENKITADACFADDLGADGLDAVELIMEFEKEFNILIPDEDALCIRTVGQAIAYIEKQVK